MAVIAEPKSDPVKQNRAAVREWERLLRDASPRPWSYCPAQGGCGCGAIWSEPLDMVIANAHHTFGEHGTDGEFLEYGKIGRKAQKANAKLIEFLVNNSEALLELLKQRI